MADKMQTVEELMLTGLTYVLDFENKVLEAAKKMAQASTNPELKAAFEKSATKGKEYAQKIELTFKNLGKPVKTEENHIAVAMINEVEHMISNSDAGPVRDAALIVAANQQQHVRIGSYGSLETFAKLLGKQNEAKGLTENLDESKGGDAKMTKLAEEQVNQAALQASMQAA